MIVDWENFKKRLIGLFNREDINKILNDQKKDKTQVMNYKYGDHIYNVLLSFFGIIDPNYPEHGNIRILIYGAWELESKIRNRLAKLITGKIPKEKAKYDDKLIRSLWEQGLLKDIKKEEIEKYLNFGNKSSDSNSENKLPDPDLWQQNIIGYLEKWKPFVSVRRGVISVIEGSKCENGSFGLKLVQKRVDMLMGIDIALYSLNLKPVEFLLVCNDQDILPAVKVAKRNGAIISSCYFEEEIKSANGDILRYSDKIRILKLTELYEGMGLMKIMNGKPK